MQLYPGELGKRIYNEISKEAWAQWQHKQTMLINEKKLSMMNPEHRKLLEQELLLKQFAVLRVHHAELFLVDQHGLLVLPLRPGFFGDFVVNTLSELARIQLQQLKAGAPV